MKNFVFLLVLFFGPSLSASNNPIFEEFTTGNPDVKSINAMAFGPEGILFIGDSQKGAIIAIETKDNVDAIRPEMVNFERIDEHIAAMLGTTTDAISIQDIAINPLSKKIYIAVHLQDGTPVLMKTDGEKMEHVPLDMVSHMITEINAIVTPDAKDGRGRELRKWTVSDLAYYDGDVMISGLSNEEFSSTFRKIPFPFNSKQVHASLEIYHGAHGQFETHSPIKTFMPYNLNGEDHLIASYTCTPLVIFPMNQIKPGVHTKGRTVAELGNRNTPLDILSYKDGDKEYILLANSSRALMKIDPAQIIEFESELTSPVETISGTAGIEFAALPYVNVLQMDKFDDNSVVFLQRMVNGDLNLYTPSMRRL